MSDTAYCLRIVLVKTPGVGLPCTTLPLSEMYLAGAIVEHAGVAVLLNTEGVALPESSRPREAVMPNVLLVVTQFSRLMIADAALVAKPSPLPETMLSRTVTRALAPAKTLLRAVFKARAVTDREARALLTWRPSVLRRVTLSTNSGAPRTGRVVVDAKAGEVEDVHVLDVHAEGGDDVDAGARRGDALDVELAEDHLGGIRSVDDDGVGARHENARVCGPPSMVMDLVIVTPPKPPDQSR